MSLRAQRSNLMPSIVFRYGKSDCLVAALLGEVGGEHQQRGELRHLGRLEVERPQVERDAILSRRHAEQEQQREQHERQAVEEAGTILPPLVVDRHHHDHDHDVVVCIWMTCLVIHFQMSASFFYKNK